MDLNVAQVLIFHQCLAVSIAKDRFHKILSLMFWKSPLVHICQICLSSPAQEAGVTDKLQKWDKEFLDSSLTPNHLISSPFPIFPPILQKFLCTVAPKMWKEILGLSFLMWANLLGSTTNWAKMPVSWRDMSTTVCIATHLCHVFKGLTIVLIFGVQFKFKFDA